MHTPDHKAHALKNAYVQKLMGRNTPEEPGMSRDLTTPPGASIGPHTRNQYVDPSMA